MEIDNSAANDFRSCPWLYYEKYIHKIELKPFPGEIYSSLEFGSRVHELFECFYKKQIGVIPPEYPASPIEKLEEEAQWVMSCYEAKYPQETFKILDVEHTFRVALPDYCPECYSDNIAIVGDGWCRCLTCEKEFPQGRHVYTGKIDLMYQEDGELFIMDHKTQQRNAKSNLPQKWAARDQATLYLWAAERIYGQPINRFVVNIIRRPSPAGRERPDFPDRQRVERTDLQVETCVRDLVVTADNIERYIKTFGDKPWPAHRENCYTWGQCEMYVPHLYGWSDELLKYKYQPKKEYLNLGGVPIIQGE